MFTMRQRDTTSDTQNEEGLFEEDLLEMLNALYKEKNKRIPLDLFLYSGQFYLGQYSIDSIETAIIELDSNGYPDAIECRLELTKYPTSQETGTTNLSSNEYFRLANV
jgi:phage protein U